MKKKINKEEKEKSQREQPGEGWACRLLVLLLLLLPLPGSSHDGPAGAARLLFVSRQAGPPLPPSGAEGGGGGGGRERGRGGGLGRAGPVPRCRLPPAPRTAAGTKEAPGGPGRLCDTGRGGHDTRTWGAVLKGIEMGEGWWK